MAKFLDFDKKNFNSAGVIPLRRGDDWKVSGTIIDKYARYQAPFDLTGISAATGFWPGASGGVIPEPFTILDAKGGQFEMDVPASDTPNIATEDSTTIYATLQHPTLGLITIETEFAVMSIQDRSFQGA